MLALVMLAACGDGTEADRRGIGAECVTDEDCFEEGQTCLTQFGGGYCGVPDCTSNLECPEASACVAHDDGRNYCFRLCLDKPECNVNRSLENEANCVGSITFVEPTDGKACEPPSDGV